MKLTYWLSFSVYPTRMQCAGLALRYVPIQQHGPVAMLIEGAVIIRSVCGTVSLSCYFGERGKIDDLHSGSPGAERPVVRRCGVLAKLAKEAETRWQRTY